MKTIIRIVYMFICLLLAACCTAPTGKTPEAVNSGTQKASNALAPTFPELDIWLIENKLAINAGKSEAAGYDKAFEQGIVLAYGEGYPLADAEGAKKRLTAVRAAEVVAQRNLAEYFARNAVNGEIKFSTYSTRMEAFLKGAEVVASEYNPVQGKAAVLLKLDLGGAKGFAR
jgi:hypothetical protein